jgi:hypothetical protein
MAARFCISELPPQDRRSSGGRGGQTTMTVTRRSCRQMVDCRMPRVMPSTSVTSSTGWCASFTPGAGQLYSCHLRKHTQSYAALPVCPAGLQRPGTCCTLGRALHGPLPPRPLRVCPCCLVCQDGAHLGSCEQAEPEAEAKLCPHCPCSFEGPWTNSPTGFSNLYFQVGTWPYMSAVLVFILRCS